MKVSKLDKRQKERFVNFIADYLSIDLHEADKVLALMIHLDDEIQDLRSIEILPYGEIKSSNENYLVLTDNEADIVSKNNAENQIDDSMTTKIKKSIFYNYIDFEKMIEDFSIDRGGNLSSRDGTEYSEEGIFDTYYIYKQ